MRHEGGKPASPCSAYTRHPVNSCSTALGTTRMVQVPLLSRWTDWRAQVPLLCWWAVWRRFELNETPANRATGIERGSASAVSLRGNLRWRVGIWEEAANEPAVVTGENPMCEERLATDEREDHAGCGTDWTGGVRLRLQGMASLPWHCPINCLKSRGMFE
jgi:hypothetical protein